MSGFELNCKMPSCSDAFPERIGSQDPDMKCHTTGIEDDPNDTEHLASQ